MRRMIFAGLCLGFGFPALAQVPLAQVPLALAPTPVLRAAAVVSTDLVRIGDLVENAGTAARIPVFRAPDPGHTGALPVSRVVDAIRSHGILLIETNDLSAVQVTRASRAIPPKQIEERIAEGLASQYGVRDAKKLQLSFDREVKALHLEPGATGDVHLARLTYDPRTGRFDASMDLAPGTVARTQLRYTGTAVETVEVATLTAPLARGQIIKAGDLAIQRRPRAEVGADTALDARAVGLAARRDLRAGQIIRGPDVTKADVVQRNEAVTLVYEVPGIFLTVRGKALESGAEGEVVAVLNIQSKRTVHGTVSGPGQVTIAAPARASNVASAAASPAE